MLTAPHRQSIAVPQHRRRRMIALAIRLRGPRHPRRKIILEFRPPAPDRLLVAGMPRLIHSRNNRIHSIGPDGACLRLIGRPVLPLEHPGVGIPEPRQIILIPPTPTSIIGMLGVIEP